MEKRKMNTRYMATLAMLCGVLLVMGVTGIGFIPLPVIKATTMHIPVILGAVLLGPGAGAVLGGVFGLCSIWVNTTSPGLLAFAFSPFMTTEGLPGVLKSLWIALGCRILFGAIAGWLWKLFKKLTKQDYVALPLTAAVSAFCHTILVMGSAGVEPAPSRRAAGAHPHAPAAHIGGLFFPGTPSASGIGPHYKTRREGDSNPTMPPGGCLI